MELVGTTFLAAYYSGEWLNENRVLCEVSVCELYLICLPSLNAN